MVEILFPNAPEDIDISIGLCGSKLNHSEFETIATNLVIISRRNGEWLKNFTIEQYKKACEHNVTVAEISEINNMAEKGFLKNNAGVFSITEKLISVYSEYAKKK